MSAKTALAIVLALSLATNAYLVVARLRGPETGPDESRSIASVVHVPAPSTPDLKFTTAQDRAKLDRAELEKRLIAAEAKLEELRPVWEKWARGTRSSADEERVRPFFDKLFETKPDEPRAYEVECRDKICKLTVHKSVSASNDWVAAIQGPEAMGLFQFRSVGGDTAFVLLRDPRSGATMSTLAKIGEAVGESTAIAECKKQYPTPGTMTFTLSFDSAGRRFRISASGPLADQPVGACVRTALDGILAAIPIQDDVMSMPDLPIPVQVP